MALDETRTAGESGHLTDHDTIHELLNNKLVAFVAHGATAATARPTVGGTAATRVLWEGSVAPDNGASGDYWWDTTADTLKRYNGVSWASPSATSIDPSGATVATLETTTSTTPTDLSTSGPAVTVTVGASGKLVVEVYANMWNSGASGVSLMGFALSGANTQAASDPLTFMFMSDSASQQIHASARFLLTGLSAGSTTVTAKYWVGSDTGSFRYRRLIATPY